VTDLVHITDHVRTALFNLNAPFIGKPRIASIVWAFVSEIKELENAIQSVINLRQLDNAGLEQLKVLGKIVGEPYASQDVEVYRAYVKARILVNRSGGTINDLLRVIQLLSTAIPSWWTENTNQVVITIANDAVVDLDGLNAMLREAKKANEGLYLYHTVLATSLQWDSSADASPATGGWGRASNTAIGGKLSRVRVR
jgi:hypothetical protein